MSTHGGIDWLVIDANFLCHRAFHSLPNLKAHEVNTQVIYGVFRDIVSLIDEFRAGGVVFCFDHGRVLRKDDFPGYKKKRHSKELTEAELAAREEFRRQVSDLRRHHLKAIGFKNVFYQKGYESDDIIASVCANIGELDTAKIISADGDLYQLLRWNVSMYNPTKRRHITAKTFFTEHGIKAHKWALVKEIGGCRTDEVTGIPGVGEGRALAYVKGALKPGAFLTKIESPAFAAQRALNAKLTKLPYPGTKTFVPEPGLHLSEVGWWDVCEALGFRSLLKKGRHNPFSRMMDTEAKDRAAFKAKLRAERAQNQQNND